ncbi:MAG: hypothetical protein HRF43_08090 [Phycisphaerae bacterium]|jgi:hypothetical protein
MAEQPAFRPPAAVPERTRRRLIALVGGAVKALTVRFYAAAIVLVVIWAGYTAVAFLVRSVLYPTRVPEQYLSWRTALSGGNLPPAAGGGEALVPRAPLEHYHRIERTLPTDAHNGCLTSGCHGALAHTKRKEIRAFANLHATFLACTLCHDAGITGPAEATWVDLNTGQPTGPPAALELLRHFELNAGRIQDAPGEFHALVAPLLPRVAAVSRDPAMEFLHVQITTSEPGSPVWRQSIARLAAELPNHVRGEYGSKLTGKATFEELERRRRALVEMAARYQAAPEGTPERRKLHDQIHEGILTKPSACLACHGGEPARLDFASLGYPPGRAAALRDSVIARQMESIQQGRPFYLPKLLEGSRER